MPVGRIILKSISQSKKLSVLKTHGARLLYTWLIPHLDKNGNFHGEASSVKGLIFTRLPDTIEDVEGYLSDLEENELIVRYEASGDIFLTLPDFAERQPKLNPDREGKTTIPVFSHELIMNRSRISPPQVKLKEVKLSLSEYTPEFESFWKEYPKLKGKKLAFNAWKEHPKKNHQELIDAAINYRSICINMKTEMEFIKDPSGFIRRAKEYWKDYLAPVEPIRKVGESQQPLPTPEKKKADDAYVDARLKKEGELKKKYSELDFDERENKVQNELAIWTKKYLQS